MPTPIQLQLLLDNPRAFLACNALKWAGAGPEDQSIIVAAMINGEGEPPARVRTRNEFLWMGNHKETVPTFILRDSHLGHAQLHDAHTLTFNAYWSGYKAGQGRDANLPAVGGPSIMLTPEFTGCAAVCHTNPDGSAKFSHYNLKKPGVDQTRDHAEMVAEAEGSYANGHTIMTKESQRAMAKVPAAMVRSTVVGFRNAGRWEFWVQHREVKPTIIEGESKNVIQIRSVVKL